MGVSRAAKCAAYRAGIAIKRSVVEGVVAAYNNSNHRTDVYNVSSGMSRDDVYQATMVNVS